jgi:hypothetical protein
VQACSPNLFQDQIYKYGSLCNRDEGARVAKERKARRVELGIVGSGSYA